jgi:general secretion pathway protein K
MKMKNRPRPTADCDCRTDEAGVILIALLWILIALSAIALSFSKESFVEVAAARNTQSLETSYFVARAGLEETIYKLLQKRSTPSVRGAEVSESPNPLDLGRVTGDFGGGLYSVGIQDEAGKINLNLAAEEQIRALAVASGINPLDADIIADSIMDWRDPDKAHRINGAEDDYYQALNPPYKAKNGRFDTVEELLMVRGVTPEYFYGYPERAPDGSITYKYGLSRYFTVYSSLNRININFAPLPVLMSVPKMSPEVALMIFQRRQAEPFRDLAEITREIPINLEAGTLSSLITQDTGTYTLTVSASTKDSRARRVIRTVIQFDPREAKQYRTLYWNENIPDYEGIAP